MKRVFCLAAAFVSAAVLASLVVSTFASAQTESGSVGIEGRIGAPPPQTGATISSPANGASFTNNPIQVAGLCPNGLIVRIYKNNVFSGSVMCEGGSFALQIDLFSGQNILIARVFDDLDQPGPDSNTVTVTLNDNSGAAAADRIMLTSNFAKRGANPGDELTWPVVVSGGAPPYAISVDWGDGQTTLQSVVIAGQFTLKHTYRSSGIYRVVVKAVDANGVAAYLQLVAVANGDVSQQEPEDKSGGETRYVFLWQPAVVLIAFVVTTFWLGKRYELRRIKKAIEEGRRPF